MTTTAERIQAALERIAEPDQRILAELAERLVRSGAGYKRGRSKQDVETPPEFFEAVCARFGTPTIDLAATASNTKCEVFFTPEADSLTLDWAEEIGDGTGWLNPPYGKLEPWARKCAEAGARGACVLMLCPASVGARWFREHVQPNALVLQLYPRIKFVGHAQSYPKDVLLCAFGLSRDGMEPWNWDADVLVACRECGCTDDEACEGGCVWVEADLCSRCAVVGKNGKKSRKPTQRKVSAKARPKADVGKKSKRTRSPAATRT
jgi:phage N-6-adenine-methyltransferase